MPEPGSNDPTIPPSQARTASVPTAAPPPRPTLARLAPGTVVSRYRVESVLGEGGMGTVYRARQEKPAREVALKVVRPGYATERMLRRFEMEAEVLGRLLHPGIAQIYEAGTADAGAGPQPFFAMELVKGVPLTRYATDQRLSTRQRLELVAKICDAVQHAHQKGVIHRDLKPANILVVESDEATQRRSDEGGGARISGRVGQPKVLDFGVARATDSDIQQTTMETDVGAIIGTLPYMSPEQVGGDPAELDTRSDVYALGVIAYELLVGRLPYSLERTMIHEAARIIREEEPTRLSSIDRALRGDVETIVAHALEKDKARRYGAASALAADIRRYLSDEPIAARPASTWYQLAKFSRRNTALVGGIAATFVVLVAGIAATAFALKRENEQRTLAQANEQRANDEKSRAEAEAERAKKAEAEEKKRADELKQVSDFQESMLAQIDPTEAGYRLQADLNAKFAAALEKANVPEAERGAMADTFRSGLHRVNLTDAARELIDRTILKPAVDAIDKQFKDQPLVDAQLRQVLATRYQELGLFDAAHPLQKQALDTRRRVLGDTHPDTLASINQMGVLLLAQGNWSESERYLSDALAKKREVLGEDHPDTLTAISNLGALQWSQGRLAEAESLCREAMDRSRRVLGDEHPDTITSIGNLGSLLHTRGNLRDAEILEREALSKRRRVLGEHHPLTLTSLNNVGTLLSAMSRFSDAEPYNREALEKHRRVLGEEHPSTLTVMDNMSMLLLEQGRFADAEPLARAALEGRLRALGPEHPSTLTSLSNLGALLCSLGRFTEAEQYWRAGLEAARRVLGEDHPATLTSINNMGHLLQMQRRYADAEPFVREALARSRRVLGEEHPHTLHAINNLGVLLLNEGVLDEAGAYLRESTEKFRRVMGEDHPETLESIGILGWLHVQQGKYAEAESSYREAMHRSERLLGDNAPGTLGCMQRFVHLYTAWDKAEPGKGHDAKAAEWKARLDAISSPGAVGKPDAGAREAEPAKNSGG